MKNLKKGLVLGLAACMAIGTLSQCKKDESSSCDSSFETTAATGMFMGSAFTVVEGTVSEDPFDST